MLPGLQSFDRPLMSDDLSISPVLKKILDGIDNSFSSTKEFLALSPDEAFGITKPTVISPCLTHKKLNMLISG